MASEDTNKVPSQEKESQLIKGTIVLEETQDHDVPWYRAEPGPRYPPQVHHLFKTYVGLPEDEILPHIKTMVSVSYCLQSLAHHVPLTSKSSPSPACQSLANPSLSLHRPIYLPKLPPHAPA